MNPRPSSYKDAARTTELHAVKVRPEGFEPTPRGLKVRCATVTPQPQTRCSGIRRLGFRFVWRMLRIGYLRQTSLFELHTSEVVAPRIELSATRLSAGYGQPALDYHSLHCIKVGCVGIEPLSVVPSDVCQPLHFTPDNLFLSVDLLGVEPRSLECKSKRRPVGKPVC